MIENFIWQYPWFSWVVYTQVDIFYMFYVIVAIFADLLSIKYNRAVKASVHLKVSIAAYGPLKLWAAIISLHTVPLSCELLQYCYMYGPLKL